MFVLLFGRLHVYLSSRMSKDCKPEKFAYFFIPADGKGVSGIGPRGGDRHIWKRKGDWLPEVFTSTSPVIFITLLTYIVATWHNYL